MFSRLLIIVGKPFYWILVGVVFLVGILLELVKQFIKGLKKEIKKLKTVKLKWLKYKITIPKVRFPKVAFPTIRVSRKGLIALGLLMVIGIAWGWIWVFKDLPKASELTSREVALSTKIYDREGKLLYQIYKDENRSLIRIDDISMKVKLATLAAEDAEFYSHPGFSLRGIMRSILKYAREDKVTGGSTITQQLVKNALLTNEKTLRRKVRELVLAVAVEQKYSKDEILEMYLNEVSYGGTAYGIAEAATVYFEKEVNELTLGEAALLAGLPQSPTHFSPFGSTPEAASARQKEILRLMRINGYITEEQEVTAVGEEIVFAQNKIDIKAPHFVMYVREQLVEKYGEEAVEKGGLNVITTLDLTIQNVAQEAVTTEVEKLAGLNVGNGAALVINPQTGEVLAMVGSKNYFDTAADGNVNVLTRLRQPGSSIKVVNYAYALANGYTAATILKDSPISFSVAGQPPYSPQNYDGRYRGNISLRSALAESRNVPAVRVLASYGVSKMLALGTEMGITSWQDPSQYGLSLTLGGGDVKMIDLARVFATIANQGKRPEIISILEVRDSKGKTLYEAGITERSQKWPQIIDSGVAFTLTDILRDNAARAPAFGSRSALVVPGHDEVAVKTGTSNNLKDNVTLGFNQNYLVATWVGNNDSSPMSRIASGITGAAPIWNRIMTNLLANTPSHDWEVPENVVQVEICTITGTLPCLGCVSRKEWFLKGTGPTTHCSNIVKEEEKEKKENKNFKPEEMIL